MRLSVGEDYPFKPPVRSEILHRNTKRALHLEIISVGRRDYSSKRRCTIAISIALGACA